MITPKKPKKATIEHQLGHWKESFAQERERGNELGRMVDKLIAAFDLLRAAVAHVPHSSAGHDRSHCKRCEIDSFIADRQHDATPLKRPGGFLVPINTKFRG